MSTRMLLAAVALALTMLALGNAAAEEFPPVDFYLDGSSDNGELVTDAPVGANEQSAPIESNESDVGQDREVGIWSYSSFRRDTNLSGTWSGTVFIYSNRDIDITIRFSLYQNDVQVGDSLEMSGSVAASEKQELTASASFAATTLGQSTLELRVESNWDPTGPPPNPPETTTIELRYGAEEIEARVVLPLSHLVVTPSGLNHNPNEQWVKLWFDVADSFGNDALKPGTSAYSFTMGPEAGAPWAAEALSVSDQGEYLKVTFLWDYSERTLEAGDGRYAAEFITSDLLSDHTWPFSFTFSLYIPPVPDVELTPQSVQARNVAPGSSYTYTARVTNTGSEDGTTFVLTTSGTLNDWGASLDLLEVTLDRGRYATVKLTITVPAAAGEGETDTTILTAKVEGDPGIYDSLSFTTTARSPPATWNFDLESDGNAWDDDCGCYLIRDRRPAEITVTLRNRGNQDNSYRFTTDAEPGIVLDLETNTLDDVKAGASRSFGVTLTLADDYTDTSGYVTLTASSDGDEREESLTLDFELALSGGLDLGSTKLKLTAAQAGSRDYPFTVENLDPTEPIRGYFVVAGVGDDDQPAEQWVSFRDEDGDLVDRENLLVLSPQQQTRVTLRVAVPGNAPLATFRLQVWMANELGDRISPAGAQYQFRIETVAAPAEESKPWLLYGAVVMVLVAGAGAVYYFTRGDSDMDWDDEEEDYLEDETEPGTPAALRLVNPPGALAAAAAAPTLAAEVLPVTAGVLAPAPAALAPPAATVATEAMTAAEPLPMVTAELPPSTELRPYGTLQKPLKSALLTMFTFGFYGFIWSYRIHKQNKECADVGPGGALGLLFMFIPGWNLVRIFLFTGEVARVQAKAGLEPTVSTRTALWYFPGAMLMGIGILVWISKLQKALNAAWVARGAEPLLPAAAPQLALPPPTQPLEAGGAVAALPAVAASLEPLPVEPQPLAAVAAVEPQPMAAVAVASEPQPVAAEPVAVAPVAVQPVVAEPVAAQPVAVEPVAAEPVAVAAVEAQPVVAESVAVAPVEAQPVAVEPVAVTPVEVQSVAVEPVAVTPVEVQSVAVEPVAVTPVEAQPVAVTPMVVTPVAAQPVTAEPVAVAPVVVQPVAEEEDADFEFD